MRTWVLLILIVAGSGILFVEFRSPIKQWSRLGGFLFGIVGMTADVVSSNFLSPEWVDTVSFTCFVAMVACFIYASWVEGNQRSPS